jgi:hypothetical protein
MEACGTKSPCLPGPIEISTRIARVKVATKVPSVHCVPRSRMKLRSIRGPSWLAARVRATRITENTTPITVMMAAASAARICREASAVPLITQDGSFTEPL